MLDDLDLMAGLVRGDHRLLEAQQALAIESHVVGRLLETRAFLGGDHAVLESFSKQLLVLHLERSETETARHLARREPRPVLETTRLVACVAHRCVLLRTPTLARGRSGFNGVRRACGCGWVCVRSVHAAARIGSAQIRKAC